MTIHEIKQAADKIKERVKEETSLDWLAYTFHYCEDKKGFIQCDVYISRYDRPLQAKRIYISKDANELMVQKAIALHIKGMLSEAVI